MWVKCTTPAGCIESKCLAVSTVLDIELLNLGGYDMFLTHPNLIISLKLDGYDFGLFSNEIKLIMKSRTNVFGNCKQAKAPLAK